MTDRMEQIIAQGHNLSYKAQVGSRIVVDDGESHLQNAETTTRATGELTETEVHRNGGGGGLALEQPGGRMTSEPIMVTATPVIDSNLAVRLNEDGAVDHQDEEKGGRRKSKKSSRSTSSTSGIRTTHKLLFLLVLLVLILSVGLTWALVARHHTSAAADATTTDGDDDNNGNASSSGNSNGDSSNGRGNDRSW